MRDAMDATKVEAAPPRLALQPAVSPVRLEVRRPRVQILAFYYSAGRPRRTCCATTVATCSSRVTASRRVQCVRGARARAPRARSSARDALTLSHVKRRVTARVATVTRQVRRTGHGASGGTESRSASPPDPSGSASRASRDDCATYSRGMDCALFGAK